MKTSAIVGALGGAILGWGFCEAWQIRVRRFDVFLPDLPASAQNCRIAQISDLHCGFIMPRGLVRKILRICARENPDLVALTGDLTARRKSYPPFLRPLASPILNYAEELAQDLSVLKPKLGIWAVPGNHDLWETSFEPIAQILEAANVRCLVNQSAILQNDLPIVGLDDLRSGNPDVFAATQNIAPQSAQLILNHNPRLAALLAPRNALILSGHTHGGQARLPGPLRVFPVDAENSAWQNGWFQVGRAQLYVSVGAGEIGAPFRFGVPPEIAVFTLKQATGNRR